jgi:hypothetical protein
VHKSKEVGWPKDGKRTAGGTFHEKLVNLRIFFHVAEKWQDYRSFIALVYLLRP